MERGSFRYVTADWDCGSLDNGRDRQFSRLPVPDPERAGTKSYPVWERVNWIKIRGIFTKSGGRKLAILAHLLYEMASSSYVIANGQRDAIVDIFYERHLNELLDVITSSCPPYGNAQVVHRSTSSNGFHGNQTSAKPEILLNIYDLLCFCVLQHPFKIKSKFMLSGVIDKVLSLTCRKEKYLVVAAIRFIRTLISIKDEQLMNHIARNNLFKPILDVFVGNGSRYNLLNSAVLELFEYIRKENLKILFKYIVETFWDQLVRFDSLPSIQSLKVRYDQAMEQATNQTGPHALNARRRVDERALEKEEEDYFNEDSDEEDSTSASVPRTSVRAQPGLPNGASANISSLRSARPAYLMFFNFRSVDQSFRSPRPGGLVDYEDDEDDDYKPPPRNKPEKSEEDEGTLEFRLKRKHSSSKQDPDLVKKQRLGGKNPKAKERVFATLRTTLSQAVLPSKKTAIATNSDNPQDNNEGLDEKSQDNKGNTSPNEATKADKGGIAVATKMAVNGS
ncbi:serine/threonine-protein phosphatase 4 regulatory subunit 3-like protein isoform X1 [Tanacetum coccineum]